MFSVITARKHLNDANVFTLMTVMFGIATLKKFVALCFLKILSPLKPAALLENLDEIIEGCKRKEAFYQEKLYRHFYPALYTLCRTFFSDNHDIISALNNGMLRVFTQIDKYDAAKGNFYSWIHTVVRNTALTYLRGSKTFRTNELNEDAAFLVAEKPFNNLIWEELFKVLEKLPTDTRAVVVLFYIEDVAIKEISAMLNMKEGTIKWHLSEGRKKLKNLLKPELFSER